MQLSGKVWLQARGLSENFLCLSLWTASILDDLESLKFVIEIVNKQLAEGQEPLRIGEMDVYSNWHDPKTKEESEIVNQIKNVFEEILAKYQTLDETIAYQLETLLWTALGAGVVEEKHMLKLAMLFRNIPVFPLRPWGAGKAVRPQLNLMGMLQSENSEVARLAAVLLSASIRFAAGERKKIQKTWVGDKYWELAKDKNDIWRSRYIQGMAYCRLKWAEKGQEWFEAIKKAETEQLQYAWCRVIEEADYCEIKDRDAFFELLLRILESQGAFTKPIRTATLQRLHSIVREVEPIGFEEKLLNLPLPQRAKIC